MVHTSTNVVGRRVAAFLIDGIIFAVIAGALVPLLGTKHDAAEVTGPPTQGLHFTADNTWTLDGGPFWIWVAIVLAVLIGIGVVLEGRTGWTPGKLALGVRVVDADGQVPGYGRAAGRLAGWLVDGFFWGLVALIVAVTNKEHRRVGDMMGGTYVVRKEAIGVPVIPAWPVAGAADPSYPGPRYPGPAVGAVGQDAFGNPLSAGGGGSVAPGVTGGPVAPVAPVRPPVPAGPKADWYPDPAGKKRLRYWDGSAWTDHTTED